MPSPASCVRCSRIGPLVTPSGLCRTCAVTEETTAPSFRPEPLSQPEPPTASFLVPREPDTAPAPDPADRPLPPAPPGYDLLVRLGGGGMGDVYLAREHASERPVAMKFLRNPGDPAALERFVVELRVLAKLDHPNIVRVYASDFLRADPYFTMEFVPGGSLAKVSDAARGVPDAVRLVRTIAVAVAVAHGADVIHRDLKPSNILLGLDGAPKIADFGLAKRLDESDPLTVASGALGTPGYMPPEQVSRRNGEIGPWSDVYGLGATLYHTLVGRAPFVGDSVVDTITKVLADPPERVRALRPEVPLALEAVVMKCLEKDPRDRYQSVPELLDDLDRYETGRKPVAPLLTPTRRAARWAKRSRRGLALAATAVALACLMVWVGRAAAPVPPVVRGTPPAAEQPDPLAGIEKELLADRSVKLIDGTFPRWKEWIRGGPELRQSATWKNAIGFETNQVCMLGLARDPMSDRYRLEVELSHDREGKALPCIGLFLGYQRFVGRKGQVVERFLNVEYSDYRWEGVDAFPDVEVRHQVIVRDNMTLWLGTGAEPACQSRQLGGLDFEPANKFGTKRKLAVEVTPSGVTFFWHEPTGWEVIHALSPRDLARENREQQANLDKNLPDTGVVLSEFDPRRPLGVYASESTVSLHTVTLSPLKP